MLPHRLALLPLVALAAWAATACGSADASERKRTTKADTLPDSVVISRADAGRYLGKEGAPIWIVMVSDFECPYCKMWHDSTMAAVRREYIETGKARMAYLNMPLPQHRHARIEAASALCAGMHNKFWEYGDSLFARQPQIAQSIDASPILDAIATRLGLDAAELAKCRESNAIRAVIDADGQQTVRANIRSTPTFFVGEFLVEGAVPWDLFKRATDSALVLAARKH